MFKPALERVASFSDEQAQILHNAISASKVHIKPDVMAESIVAAAKGSLPDMQDVAQALVNLSISRFKAAIPLDEFAAGISRSLKTTDPDKRGAFEKRLKSLLDIDSLVRASRAFDIQHEYEKVFRSARIISDIRPVFSPAGTEAMGAMIVHNLNVSYFEAGEYKESVFALDDADIGVLKKVIERAEIKSRTSEQLIKKAGIEYFESK
jgi:hypothetical protein